MFKHSLLILLVSGFVITRASGESLPGKLNVEQPQSTVVTLYSDKALVSQRFNAQPDGQGSLKIAGLPINRLDGSLNLEYIDGDTVYRPEDVFWYQGGLDRDNYYRNLVGKNVELFGGGLNVAIQGKLVSYQQGVGLVEGNNGRQYLIDYHDPQGLRILSQASSETQGENLKYVRADFGQQSVSGPLKLSYITPQLSYDSHYRLTLLSHNQGRLELKTLLTNSANINFDQATIRLVAGGEGGVDEFYQQSRMLKASAMADTADYGERVGEVLLTTLPKGTVLPANSRQLMDLFSEPLHLEKLYTLDVYGRSTGGRTVTAERPRLTWKFEAPLDLPPAQVRVYEQDPDGGYIISGHSWLPKTTAGDNAWLTMGEALAVRVERNRVDVEQKSSKELVVKWQVTVSNDQQDSITLLLRERDANLIKLDSVRGATLEKPDLLRVEVAAGTSKAIHYTAKYRR
ncbi:hypothetical protein [Salinisphaera sp. G21_0]|uniref:hypothetical protein n=1 Tax=Salinisphaera sp. G21_0 TaxID=2821094 RepID=UPI001ADB28B0|nr:hypothetical protein [Salinisphaera sp. G21_0]MBO9481470.1 hypothetical protein [Salinisphaera sp. G21_0]